LTFTGRGHDVGGARVDQLDGVRAGGDAMAEDRGRPDHATVDDDVEVARAVMQRGERSVGLGGVGRRGGDVGIARGAVAGVAQGADRPAVAGVDWQLGRLEGVGDLRVARGIARVGASAGAASPGATMPASSGPGGRARRVTGSPRSRSARRSRAGSAAPGCAAAAPRPSSDIAARWVDAPGTGGGSPAGSAAGATGAAWVGGLPACGDSAVTEPVGRPIGRGASRPAAMLASHARC
jgi:hypothetical protein